MTPQDILTKRKIDFNPKGRDLLVRCLNPEHEDKRPSMRIDSITGVFQCWSCGFKGNLFAHFGQRGNALQMRRQNLKDKIQLKLAENVGLEIPVNAVPFQKRWRGISPETFAKFEAFQHSNPEFIGRVVFPVRTQAGKIRGFIGRHMQANHDPKYLVHPSNIELPLFPPNPEPINGRIILVEGIIDMLNLWDKGLTNVMCTFGTSTLLGKKSKGPEKLTLLKFKGVYGIDIIFDGDDAGRRAAESIQEMLINRLEFDATIPDISWEDGQDAGALTADEVMSLKEYLYGESSYS
jgi:DNA primase